MELTATIGANRYAVALQHPHDLSIPIRSDTEQLSVFGSLPASAEPLRTWNFVGSVAQGGSCNCLLHHFCAHTNGTHTEGIGHIQPEATSVGDVLRTSLFPATVMTLRPEMASDSHESYNSTKQPDDLLLTAAMLSHALASANPAFFSALIFRTLPNDGSKRTRHYNNVMPPYFTHEAMHLLLQYPVQHLLVDLPSIDRLADDGALANHHLFWNDPHSRKTVTELIYVPSTVADGHYLLDLGIAPFVADAAPSRPLLYELTRL